MTFYKSSFLLYISVAWTILREIWHLPKSDYFQKPLFFSQLQDALCPIFLLGFLTSVLQVLAHHKCSLNSLFVWNKFSFVVNSYKILLALAFCLQLSRWQFKYTCRNLTTDPCGHCRLITSASDCETLSTVFEQMWQFLINNNSLRPEEISRWCNQR